MIYIKRRGRRSYFTVGEARIYEQAIDWGMLYQRQRQNNSSAACPPRTITSPSTTINTSGASHFNYIDINSGWMTGRLDLSS